MPLSPVQNKLKESLATLAEIDNIITARIQHAEELDARLAEKSRQVEERIASAEKHLDIRQKQLDADLADHRDFLERFAQSLKQELSSHAQSLIADLNRAAQSFGEDLIAHLQSAEHRAEEVIDSVDKKLDEARNPIHLDLDEISSAARQNAEEVLCSSRQIIMNEISNIEQETRAWIRPILREISDYRATAEGQIQSAIDSFAYSIRSKIEEIRRGTESEIQLAQRRLLPPISQMNSPKIEITLPLRKTAQAA